MIPLLYYGFLTLISCVIGLILYARWYYGTLEKLNIPVEPPTFMFGSCPDFYTKNPQLEDIKRFKKYGTVFGIYEGRSPQVFVADPELLKLIFVRDYEHFNVRASIDLGHAVSNEILDYLPGDKWKKVRSMLTPQFTSGKMRQMMPLISEIADEFAKGLMKECKEDRMSIDLRNRAIAVLIDTASTGLFGMEIENRKDPDNAFVQLMKQILCEHVEYDFRYSLMLQFPFLSHIFPSWPFPTEGIRPFEHIIRGYLKTRQQDTTKRNDLGDVFLDMFKRVNTPEFQKLGIIEETAIGNILELFFTAYDTTGTPLAMCAYYLAQNPECQEKVLQEVDAMYANFEDGELNFEAITELPYLTACINEGMRLSPPFIRPERLCTKDWMAYRDNGVKITIPKGTNVLIPIWALHRHPEYFPDPETFNPDRFMPENKSNLHPYAFAPFGHGPKNCIGMNFAYTNIKVILARLFKDFKFEMRDDTKLNFKKGTRFVVQYAPLYLDLVKRY